MSDEENYNENEESYSSPKRSKSRTSIMVAVVFPIIVLAVIVFIMARRNKPEEETIASDSTRNEVCLSQGCVREAHLMIKKMNSKMDPCEDFYEYSCGNFIKTEAIPKSNSVIDTFSNLRYLRNKKLRRIFEAKIETEDSHTTRIVKDLYTTCMDEEKIEILGLRPIHNLISGFGGWPVVVGESWKDEEFSWSQTALTSRNKGLSHSSLFSLFVQADMKNASKTVLTFDQPLLILERERLIEGLPNIVVASYLNYSIDVAVLLGANRSLAEKEMKDVLDFEVSLAWISQSKADKRNISKLYFPTNLSEFKKMSPIVDWVDFVNGILSNSIKVNLTERIVVKNLNYFKNLTRLIRETPKRILSNYMIWKVIFEIESYLSRPLRDLKLPVVLAKYGTSSYKERWIQCVLKTMSMFGLATSSIYVRNYFDPKARMQANELTQYLRSEFEKMLREVDWMDEQTRQEAIKKAKSMKQLLAYPPQLLDEDILQRLHKDLNITNDSYLNNALRSKKFTHDCNFDILRQTGVKNVWIDFGTRAALVNAFYNAAQNSIEFPAGVLQGQLFEPDRPKYMNFAGIGVIIGHEIVHGFDDTGKQTDSDGNLRNWWLPETKTKFHEKAKCIIDQYGNYSENGLKLNGFVTQGENIADNGGTLQAYEAYQTWVKDNGVEKTLPGVHHLNPNQLFWLSSAQKTCSIYRPQFLKTVILTWHHVPWKYRIIGVYTNIEAFARDWNCPIGSRMNPINKCRVW